MKQVSQSRVTVKEIWKSNGLPDERLDDVLKSAENSQATQIVDIVGLNTNNTPLVQTNDSEVE